MEYIHFAINSKTICKYDYFVDNSVDISKILDINIVDAWLYKFGIIIKKFQVLKNIVNLIVNILNYQKGLSQKLLMLKKRGKLLLFHPYSATIR